MPQDCCRFKSVSAHCVCVTWFPRGPSIVVDVGKHKYILHMAYGQRSYRYTHTHVRSRMAKQVHRSFRFYALSGDYRFMKSRGSKRSTACCSRRAASPHVCKTQGDFDIRVRSDVRLQLSPVAALAPAGTGPWYFEAWLCPKPIFL